MRERQHQKVIEPSKVLSDLISSAAAAKTHYDIWWAQMSDARHEYFDVMSRHRDFFRASQDAHYTACFIYLAHLFDRRADSSSLPTYLSLISKSVEYLKFQDLEARFSALAIRVDPLIKVRHKTIAHIDSCLSEKDVFRELTITWNEVRAIVYESASLIEELAGAQHQGSVGIPRDGRLGEATLKMICLLK